MQSELYLGPQGQPGDLTKMVDNQWDAVVFNGYHNQYKHAPIHVEADKRYRVWVVGRWPQRELGVPHRRYHLRHRVQGGSYVLQPDQREGGSQVLDLQPAQGGFVEFTFAEDGLYPFVTHKFPTPAREHSGSSRSAMSTPVRSVRTEPGDQGERTVHVLFGGRRCTRPSPRHVGALASHHPPVDRRRRPSTHHHGTGGRDWPPPHRGEAPPAAVGRCRPCRGGEPASIGSGTACQVATAPSTISRIARSPAGLAEAVRTGRTAREVGRSAGERLAVTASDPIDCLLTEATVSASTRCSNRARSPTPACGRIGAAGRLGRHRAAHVPVRRARGGRPVHGGAICISAWPRESSA